MVCLHLCHCVTKSDLVLFFSLYAVLLEIKRWEMNIQCTFTSIRCTHILMVWDFSPEHKNTSPCLRDNSLRNMIMIIAVYVYFIIHSCCWGRKYLLSFPWAPTAQISTLILLSAKALHIVFMNITAIRWITKAYWPSFKFSCNDNKHR